MTLVRKEKNASYKAFLGIGDIYWAIKIRLKINKMRCFTNVMIMIDRL